tara:strand:+ start:464 stop:1375 length:912 start_codon:yes stop_codon:yes gene_type:complete
MITGSQIKVPELPKVITNTHDEGLINLLEGSAAEMELFQGEQLIREAAERFHVVVIDYSSLSEGISDRDLVRYLKAIHDSNGVKTVLIGYDNDEMATRCYNAGLVAGVVPSVCRSLSAVVKPSVQNAFELFKSERDYLTKLFDRRYVTRELELAVEKANDALEPVSLLFLDLDYFKAVNDNYGHSVGDSALRAFANVLKKTCRGAGDVPARFGGEEFLVVAKSTGITNAYGLAERISESTRKIAIPLPENKFLQITVSGGLTTYNGVEDLSAEELLGRADKRLYAAKEAGRDRIFGPNEMALE